MKKFAVCVVMTLLLTACGSKIVLPDPEDICQVTVSGGGMQTVIDDEVRITELLQEMGKAHAAGNVSIEDRPALQIDFTFRQGGVGTLFLYQEHDRVILERPFQKIYETSKTLLDYFE